MRRRNAHKPQSGIGRQQEGLEVNGVTHDTKTERFLFRPREEAL
jgi:hypothetical protein